MQSTNIPTKIPLPFAYAATGSYIATIPTASQIGVTNGKASLHDGFPPLTFTPISTGGVPPFGADFNGILNEITAITQWQQAGGFFPYDSAFSTTVGGYPKGAVILSSSFNGFWLSSTENNTTNPDTGGAGWVATAFQGLQSIAMSSTSVTMTTLQAAYPIVTITGTLTANSTLIVPSQVNEWIFSNQTSGAYTLTVKTAAGTGVVITAGSSQYTWSDGTNVYFANASAVTSFNTRTGAIVLNSTDVTSALGFTPYNATNPNNYGPPVGSIIQFAGTSSPAGYLACPLVQTLVSTTTYSALFSAIGYSWGGSGSSFGLPYFAQGLTGVQANSNVGAATVGEVISHTHTTNAVYYGSGVGFGYGTSGPNGATIGSTGGTNNLAAGMSILYCVKYQ